MLQITFLRSRVSSAEYFHAQSHTDQEGAMATHTLGRLSLFSFDSPMFFPCFTLSSYFSTMHQSLRAPPIITVCVALALIALKHVFSSSLIFLVKGPPSSSWNPSGKELLSAWDFLNSRVDSLPPSLSPSVPPPAPKNHCNKSDSDCLQ